jgi:hypothetical protein
VAERDGLLTAIAAYVGPEKLVTTAMAIWAALAPLVGVLIGG